MGAIYSCHSKNVSKIIISDCQLESQTKLVSGFVNFSDFPTVQLIVMMIPEKVKKHHKFGHIEKLL
jgi:hypothetical protein